MRRWTLVFLLVALVAAPVGFGGLDPGLRAYARVVFFAAVLMAACALAGGRDWTK